MLRLGFIGAGTVGTALAVRLSSKGYHVVAVSSRSQASAKNLAQAVSGCQTLNNNQAVADAAELVFITAPDDAIASVASEIQWHAGQSVVHYSGADSTDILQPAKKLGAHTSVFHPLQTFAIPPHQATQALLPLIRGTIHNIDIVGIPQCLTGPVARGDTGTIKKHLDASQKIAPGLLSTYREVGQQTIPIALAKGRINQHQAQELETILKQPD